MKVALTKVPRPCGHPAMKQAYGPPTDPPVPAPPAPATRVPQVNVTVYVGEYTYQLVAEPDAMRDLMELLPELAEVRTAGYGHVQATYQDGVLVGIEKRITRRPPRRSAPRGQPASVLGPQGTASPLTPARTGARTGVNGAVV